MSEKETAPRVVYLKGILTPFKFPAGTTDEQIDQWLYTPDAAQRVAAVHDRMGYLDALKSGGLGALSQMALGVAGPENINEATGLAGRLQNAADTSYFGPRSGGDVVNSFKNDGVLSGLNALGKMGTNVAGVYAAPPVVGTLAGSAAGMPALGLGAGLATDFGLNATTMTGANVAEQQHANPDQDVDFTKARAVGIPEGAALTALNLIPGGSAARMAIANGARQGLGALAKHALVGAGTGAAMMPAINAATRAQAGEDLTSPEAIDQYLGGMATGGMLGGTLGGIAGLRKNSEINARIAERGSPASPDFMGANAPAPIMQERAARAPDIPSGAQGDLFGAPAFAEPTVINPKSMADQLTAYRDHMHQQLVTQGADEKIAQKTANQLAAKQAREAPPVEAAAPVQASIDDLLTQPQPEVTPAQQRLAADQNANALPHIINTGGPRPEQIAGGLNDFERAQLAANARQTLSRAPMQENGNVAVPPEVQAQQFAQGMAQTPVGQTSDMFNLPSQRAAQLNEAEMPHGDQTQVESQAQNEPLRQIESGGQEGRSDGSQNGQAVAAQEGQIAPVQEPLLLVNKPLSIDDQRSLFSPEETPVPVTEPTVISPNSEAVSLKNVGAPKAGETSAQTIARELSNNKRDALQGAPHVDADDAATAKSANKAVVQELMQRVNKELPAPSAVAVDESARPPLIDALAKIALDPQSSDKIASAARTVHKRLTGVAPENVPADIAPEQRTLVQQGVEQAQAANAEPTVRPEGGVANPDILKGALLARTDIPATAKLAGEWLSRTASEPWMRDLAKKLRPYMNDTPVHVVKATTEGLRPEVADALRNGANGVTVYDPATGKAEIYMHDVSGHLREDVLLHEMTHAASEKALADPKNAALRREIDGIRKQLLKNMGDVEGAEFFRKALINPEELLSYAHSSPTLREFMRSIDGYSNAAAPKFKLWDRFVNAIRKLLGMAPKRVEDLLNQTGGSVITGQPGELHAHLDDLLNRVLEARGPDVPFSEAAAVRMGGPVARTNLQFAGLMDKLPHDKAEATVIAKNVVDGVSEALDVLSNKFLSNQSSYESRLRASNPGVDMANGAARPDIIGRLAGNGMQVFQQVAENGGMRVNAQNLWEVIKQPFSLKGAADNAVNYANKYGLKPEQWRAKMTDYSEAFRQEGISKYLAHLETLMPQSDVDPKAYQALVKSMKDAREAAGVTLTDEQMKTIRSHAKQVLQKELNDATGLEPRNLSAIRDTINQLAPVITLSENQRAERLAWAKQMPELETARKELRGVVRQAVDAAHNGGAFSKDYADSLNSREEYSSFARLKDFDPSDFDGQKRGSLRALPTLAEIHGDTAPLKDVYEATHDTVNYLTQTAIKAHAGRSMAEGAKELLGARDITRMDVTNANRDRVVSYLDNGKVKFLELQNAHDVDAFKGYSAVQSKYLNMFRSVAGFLRTAIVINPSFAERQLIMDADSAGLMAGVKNPIAVAKDTLAYGVKLMTAAARNKELDDPYVLRLKKHGITGRYDVVHAHELSELDALHSAPSSVFGMVKDRGTAGVRWFERVASAAELAQRVAVMKRVEMEGGSLTDQLFRAQAIMDYNRHGTSPVASMISQTVPFVTSRLSATHLILRTLVGRGLTPGDRAVALKQLGQNVLLMTAMHSLYAIMTDDNEDIQNMPIEQRYKNMYIPMGDGHLFAIPVRPEPGLLFKWLPERLWQLHKNDGLTDSGKQALKDGMHTFADAFGWDFPLPAAIKPVAENALNYSFFTGKPIVSDHLKDMPSDQQFNDATSPIAKLLGQSTGMSPMMLDNILKGYTGSLSNYASAVTYHLGNVFSDKPQPARAWQDEPFMKDFVKNSSASTQSINDFYEMQSHIRGAAEAYKAAIQRNDFAGATALQSKYQTELSQQTVIGRVGRQLQQINAAIKNINGSTIPNESKVMQVNQLKAIRAGLARQVESLKLQMND